MELLGFAVFVWVIWQIVMWIVEDDTDQEKRFDNSRQEFDEFEEEVKQVSDKHRGQNSQ